MALGSSLKKKESRPPSPRALLWDSAIRIVSNSFSLFLWQYRATTRGQLYHRLLSEHKVLIDEFEQTKAELRDTCTSF